MKPSLKNPLLWLSLLSSGVLLMGCEQVKTTQYYQQNPEKMKQVLTTYHEKSLKGDKLEGKFAENCHNASAANLSLMRNAMIQANLQ